MEKIITFKHSGNTGDIIYSLDFMNRASSDGRAILYIHLNQPSGFTESQHPLGEVMMNQTMYDLLRPLLIDQPWIDDVRIYNGETVDYDLDLFRTECKNLSAGNIMKWYDLAFPEVVTNNDFTNMMYPPLSCEPIENDYIIVNRTSRYNNILIDYTQLKAYDNVVFVGTESEYKKLTVHNDNLTHMIVKDFHELARYIAGCRLYIGNQSMAFAIAEMLKVGRVLEQYMLAPNVIPDGGRYYVFHTNDQFSKILSLALPESAKYKDRDKTKGQASPSAPEGSAPGERTN